MEKQYTKEELQALSNKELCALKNELSLRREEIRSCQDNLQKVLENTREEWDNNNRNLASLEKEQSKRLRAVRSVKVVPITAYESVNFHPENLESLPGLRFVIKTQKYMDDKLVVEEEERSTTNYVLFNNVLLGVGGGWAMLTVPAACSDDEWESMKRGEIPEKFFRK
jgi:hypothetical protein